MELVPPLNFETMWSMVAYPLRPLVPLFVGGSNFIGSPQR